MIDIKESDFDQSEKNQNLIKMGYKKYPRRYEKYIEFTLGRGHPFLKYEGKSSPFFDVTFSVAVILHLKEIRISVALENFNDKGLEAFVDFSNSLSRKYSGKKPIVHEGKDEGYYEIYIHIPFDKFNVVRTPQTCRDLERDINNFMRGNVRKFRGTIRV